MTMTASQVTIVCSWDKKASLVYSTTSRFSSPMKGVYETDTVCDSIVLSGGKTSLFTRSFALRCCRPRRFFMSLFPRWFEEATTFTRKASASRYSTTQDFAYSVVDRSYENKS